MPGAPLVYRSSGFEPRLWTVPGAPTVIQGEFSAHVWTVMQVFGKPVIDRRIGVTALEWSLLFSDGMRAVVQGPSLGRFGEGNTRWLILGHNSQVLPRVIQILLPYLKVKDAA